MKTKILGVVLMGLLASSADAGVIFTTDTATELRGTLSVTGQLTTQYFTPSTYNLGLNDGLCESLQTRRTDSLLTFGATCEMAPDNPWLIEFTSTVFQSYPDIAGYYDRQSSGTATFNARNYFRFWDLQDTGGNDGTLSGRFCFSTNATTCNAGSVPEPGTLALLLTGLAGLGLSRRRKTH